MTQDINEQEFELLGYKVRFKSDQSGDLDPKDVVARVNEELQALLLNSPSLDRGRAALLVALKLASQQMTAELQHKDDISRLKSDAIEALSFIEDAAPNLQ